MLLVQSLQTRIASNDIILIGAIRFITNLCYSYSNWLWYFNQCTTYIYIILYSIVLNLISAWALFVAVMSNHIVTYWYSCVFSNSLLIHITLIQFCATITHDFKSRTYSEFIVDWVVSTTLPQCRKSPKAASFWAIVATVWLLHVIIRRQSHSTCIALLHIYVFAIHLLHSHPHTLIKIRFNQIDIARLRSTRVYIYYTEYPTSC